MALKAKRATRQAPTFAAPTRRPGSMGQAKRQEANWLRTFWQSPQLINQVTSALLALSLLLALYLFGAWATRWSVFDFRAVSVNGDLPHLQKAEIETLVRRWRGNFLTLDLRGAREDLLTLAWVKQADVARRWPAELVLEITEHVPVARWGRRSLVDADGEVFAASSDKNLPHFFGSDDTALLVIEQHQKLTQQLAPVGLKPVQLRLSPRMAWEVELNNGFKLELGRDDIDGRVQTFLTAYRVELHNLAASGAVIDLRYKHGLALKVAQLPKTASNAKPASAAARERM